jgi:hypothetical protein
MEEKVCDFRRGAFYSLQSNWQLWDYLLPDQGFTFLGSLTKRYLAKREIYLEL